MIKCSEFVKTSFLCVEIFCQNFLPHLVSRACLPYRHDKALLSNAPCEEESVDHRHDY